jgi:hypothetical protein
VTKLLYLRTDGGPAVPLGAFEHPGDIPGVLRHAAEHIEAHPGALEQLVPAAPAHGGPRYLASPFATH